MRLNFTKCLYGLAAIALVGCTSEAERSHPGNTTLPASPIERCMNMSSALEAPEEGLWGYTVQTKDLARIKQAGFDTIRLPVKWSAHSGDTAPYTLSADMLARTDSIISTATGMGLNVILDVHHYSELNEDPATHEPRLEAIWAHLSSHYEDAPNGLIFEIINEPYDKMTTKRTDALNARILDKIRETHPDRWVILGTANWGNLDGMLRSTPPQDARIIASFHYYSPFEFTHQGAFFVDPPLPTGRTWGAPDEREAIMSDLRKAANYGARHNIPVFMGEFGVYENVPLEHRAAWTQHVRRTAEAEGLGWCAWGFATTFKAYDQEREQWIAPLKTALIDD